MKRSARTYASGRTTPSKWDIPEEQRAEMHRLSAAMAKAHAGEWDEALLWRYTTDPEFRALCAAEGITVPA